MDSDKRMPPDAPENASNGHSGAASEFASRTIEGVKESYDRAKEKIAAIDPRDAVRDAGRYVQETGEAAVETVERHPFAAFALGALSVGLIAWATMGRRSPSWQSDSSGWSGMLHDYGDDAVKAGRRLIGSSREQLDQGRDYLNTGRDYAREGGRMLAVRTEREPLAAVLGIGLALYVLGSLFTGSEPQPARRRAKR